MAHFIERKLKHFVADVDLVNANSASYPQRDGKRVLAFGLVWLIETICLHATL